MPFQYEETESQRSLDRVWVGTIASDAVDYLDTVDVIIPHLSSTLRWEDCPWQTRDNYALPKRGNDCVVVIDNDTKVSVIAWWPDERSPTVTTSPYQGGPPDAPMDKDIWIARDADQNGNSYMFQWDDTNNQWDQISAAGGSGQLYRGTWSWTNSTTAAAAGYIGNNQSGWAGTTQINIAKMSGTSTDSTNVINAVLANDFIYIQDQGDATKWGKFKVVSPAVAHGAYFSFAVTVDSSAGATPNNNRDCLVLFTRPATGIGIPTPVVNGQWLKGVGGIPIWQPITPADIAGYPSDNRTALLGDGTWGTVMRQVGGNYPGGDTKIQVGQMNCNMPSGNPVDIVVPLPYTWTGGHLAFIASAWPTAHWSFWVLSSGLPTGSGEGKMQMANTGGAQMMVVSYFSIGIG